MINSNSETENYLTKIDRSSLLTSDLENYPIFLSQYLILASKLEKISKLGQGKFFEFSIRNFVFSGISGVVHLMKYHYQENTIKVADKSIPKTLVDSKDIKREIELFSSCDHKNIVNFIGYYEETLYFHIVTEYMEGGDLNKFLKDDKNVSVQKSVF